MKKPIFQVIWRRIVAHAGQTFWTKTALPFAYSVEGAGVKPTHAGWRLRKRDFEVAYALVPFGGTGLTDRNRQRSATLWGILHDPRISHVLGPYFPLESFLLLVPRNLDVITLGLTQIELILRLPLPETAFATGQWWVGRRTRAHARSWMKAGFEVDVNGVDLEAGWVRFRRIRT